MVDVSDPRMTEAYQNIRDDTNELEWVIVAYEDNTKVVVQEEGKGFDFVEKLKDDEVVYVFFRVISGDRESKRPKFVFLSWLGDNAPVMRKARVSVHKADIKTIFRDFAVELQCSEKSDLAEDVVMAAVKKAGGADYSRE